MTETELIPPPLDAYATAKPDEPTFTLQGGDPLAGPLVRLWAWMARRRAGVPGSVPKDDLTRIARHHQAADDKESAALLIRATQAESVSWDMDAYLKDGELRTVEVEPAAHFADEVARIDLHDLRVRAAQRLSNFQSEITEMVDALIDADFDDHNSVMHLTLIAEGLKELHEAVEPRRALKKD